MRTITFCLISLALIGTVLSGDVTTTSSNSATAGTFVTAPVQVLDAQASTANTTDTAKWGTGKNVDLTTVAFGPGATNDTIYMWAATTTSAGSPAVYTLTGFLSRKISATQILNGTNTAKEEPVLSAGDAGSASATIQGSYRWAVGPGTYGFASSQALPTGAAATSQTSYSVILYLVTPGGSSKAVTIIAGPATVADAASGATTMTGSIVKYNVDGIFQEDGTYYVLYETQTRTQTATTPTYSYALNGLYVQGAFANSTLVYTTPQVVSTSFAAATTALVTSTTFGTQILTGALIVGSNYTNSTNFLIGYQEDPTVGVKAGILGKTAGSTFTSQTYMKTATAGTKTYTLALGGVWASNATYGFTLINSTTDSSTSPSTVTYGAVGAFNNSASTTGLGGFTFGSNMIGSVNGYRYTTNVIGVAATAGTSQITYTAQNFYPNITSLNGTAMTLGSFDFASIQPQYFTDVNGSSWVGYASTSVFTPNGGSAAPANVGVAYVGRLLAQVNILYPSAANALTTIAALLSFVIASIFMF